MNLRCFIAIEIPELIRKEISGLIDNLKKYDADVKWIHAENIHLTLKFLGNTPEILLPKINDSLSAVVASYKPFYITIGDTGVFPNRKFPKVCWIGIEDTGMLKTLRGDIETSMKRLGFKSEEREFNPHLTIGRVRSRQGMISILNELDQYKGRTFGGITVDRISIMKSELKPEGAEYTCLYEAPFGKIKYSTRREDDD
jgi:RNA 2',3'-cyclic 3'-phosphodiesterase